MELRDANGSTSIVLKPTGYQFTSPVPSDEFDRNWLNIQGHISTADGTWSFESACMLTNDGARLSRWLRSVADAIEPIGSPNLVFVEPNVEFGIDGYAGTLAAMSVRFAHESAPSWWDTDADFERRSDGYCVLMNLEAGEIREAADSWDREFEDFPER